MLAVALVILTVANVMIPADLRTPAATVTSTPGEGPVGVTSIAIFYVAANSYLLYAFAAACVWTRRYARGAEPRLRRGLRIASIGLAAISLAGATFVASNISRWAGTPAPPPVVITSIFLLLLGIVLFVVGMAYPTVRTRMAALRVWRRHRRAYRRLRPLWTVLNEQFPQDALSRVPASPWRDALTLRSVHRRYYRRVIECRDGLVRISPYLANLGADPAELADPERLASRLSGALRAHAAGETVPPQAIPLALPAEDSLEADVDRLVELSQAVERAARPGHELRVRTRRQQELADRVEVGVHRHRDLAAGVRAGPLPGRGAAPVGDHHAARRAVRALHVQRVRRRRQQARADRLRHRDRVVDDHAVVAQRRRVVLPVGRGQLHQQRAARAARRPAVQPRRRRPRTACVRSSRHQHGRHRTPRPAPAAPPPGRSRC